MPTSEAGAILIAIEGIDGAGKTTQVNLLRDALSAAGEAPLTSKEPTDGRWGRKIKASAANGRLPLTDELQAFIEDRAEHVKTKIRPALSEGRIIILDRYFYSTIAYQGCRGADVDEIEREMVLRFPVPDAVFVLDVDPALSLHRIHHSRKDRPNEFEKLEELTKARAIFQNMTGVGHVHVVDGAMSPSAVHTEIVVALVNGALKAKRCFKNYGCDDQFNCSYRLTNSCEWFQISRALSAIAANSRR